MLKNNHLISLFFLIIFSFFSCNSEKKEQNAENSNRLTGRQMGDFGFQIEQAISNADTAKFNQLIQPTKLEQQALKQINFRGDTLIVYTNLIKAKVNKLSEIPIIANNSIVEMTHLDTSTNRLTFTIFSGGRNLEFLELQLSKKNTINIDDYTFFTQGVSFLDQVEQTKLIFENKSSNEDFPYGYLAFQDNMNKLENIILNIEELEDTAIAMVDLIPKELIKLQEINNGAMYIANQLNNSYLENKLLKKKIELTTNQNAIKYLNYLNAAYNNDYNTGIHYLEELNTILNENEYLDYLIGTLYYELFDFKNAIENYNNALAIKPEVFDFHFAKVIAFIEMNEYEMAVESLLVMDDFFDMNTVNWDKELMAYPEFLMSDSYFKWQERTTKQIEM